MGGAIKPPGGGWTPPPGGGEGAGQFVAAKVIHADGSDGTVYKTFENSARGTAEAKKWKAQMEGAAASKQRDLDNPWR